MVEEGDFYEDWPFASDPGATMVQMSLRSIPGERLLGALAVRSPLSFLHSSLFLFFPLFYFKMQTLGFVQALFKGVGAIVIAILSMRASFFGNPFSRLEAGFDYGPLLHWFFFRLNILLSFPPPPS